MLAISAKRRNSNLFGEKIKPDSECQPVQVTCSCSTQQQPIDQSKTADRNASFPGHEGLSHEISSVYLIFADFSDFQTLPYMYLAPTATVFVSACAHD